MALAKCPRCAEPVIPQGLFFARDDIKVSTRVKLFLFWVPVNVTLEVSYCPKCGFLKVVPTFG